MYTRDADMHVMVTSYDMVVRDAKYISRVNWQYMVLDEAQAIKSATSARWATLLSFKCRNRLLLTGTPIQNTMAELWALLHFIMPTLFDSHAEFNQWFSKDIESHAANGNTELDRTQLSRLHMILKPFMLRRVKKNVEHELPGKSEVLMYCPLSTRQERLYRRLKSNLNINQLVVASTSNNKHGVESEVEKLLNLVMQFRKVCNHPNLLNRRYLRTPFVVEAPRWRPMHELPVTTQYVPYTTVSALDIFLPRLLFDEILRDTTRFGGGNGITHLPSSFYLHSTAYIHSSMMKEEEIYPSKWMKYDNILNCATKPYGIGDSQEICSLHAPLLFSGLSAQEVHDFMTASDIETLFLARMTLLHQNQRRYKADIYQSITNIFSDELILSPYHTLLNEVLHHNSSNQLFIPKVVLLSKIHVIFFFFLFFPFQTCTICFEIKCKT